MKLVMTLMVRDEVDIIEQQLAFHLAAGVDFFVVTDHASEDGTTEVLERYARDGLLHLVHESDRTKRQSEWVTRMARMAATDFDADWVINSDADEFWWPCGGSLKEVLAQIPDRYGIVQTFVRPFLPRPGSGSFADRMTIRFTPPAPLNSPFTAFRVNVRLLHRAAPDVRVGFGNATVWGRGLVPLAGHSLVEVFHFPIRSREQFERKFATKHQTAGGRQRGDTLRVHDAAKRGELDALYDEIFVDDLRLRRGVEAGSLAVDTRLRDALRSLTSGPTTLRFQERDISEEVGYAVDAAALEAGQLVRLHRRVDELERRVRNLDRRSSRGQASLRTAI